MLEIKNLTKIYKTKGGADVKALDDVSIKFEQTGLVFLLGKSGSGKSTLLNVAGGLDEPTSGEITVMGKSSAEFTGGDFDSYRNTYVGFIFQEYNVLNEFSVEDNVAIALELQGKGKDREKIAEILRTVELGNFAKRKPNTLSGGQKQRIAIARALVKDPQIIMADEPTGALDSATGKQVFDTLKKLSETRLVIVVSHDREFAEIYGDRIVELKDGKIISDVVKVKEEPTQTEGGFLKIGEDTLSFDGGESLTKENIAQIESFLKESDGKIIISRGEKEIKSFKKANRIDDDGRRERFDNTDEETLDIKKYEKDEAKFIRSKLPAKRAVAIGASNLKIKPVRLILTMFLSIISFIMFGLFSTMMLYNETSVMTRSFAASGYEYLLLNKNYKTTTTYTYRGDESESTTYESHIQTKFTPADFDKIKTDGSFTAYNLNAAPTNLRPNATSQTNRYNDVNIFKIATISADHPLASKITAGKFPEKSNEILVSAYFAESANICDYYDVVNDDGKLADKPTAMHNKEDIVGKQLVINGQVCTVSGIFDGGAIPSKYESLKTTLDDRLYMAYVGYMGSSINKCVLTTEQFIKDNPNILPQESERYERFFDYSDMLMLYYSADKYMSASGVKTYDSADDITFFQSGATGLKDNQIIVSLLMFFNGYFEPGAMSFEESYNYNDFTNAAYAISYPKNSDATAEQLAEARQYVTKYLSEHGPYTVNVYVEGSRYNDPAVHQGQYEIAGFIVNEGEEGIICPDALYDSAVQVKITTTTKYVAEADAMYDCVYLPYDGSEAAFKEVLKGLEVVDADTDVLFTLENSLYETVQEVDFFVKVLYNVFLVAGIIITVFAALLLFNFISVSISNKKKEIGILRAVGARGIDVFKIFISESGIIVGICTVVSLICTLLFTSLLNSMLRLELNLAVKLFVFGPLPILFMVAVAVFVAFISTFIPVYLASKKKPVDSIRAL